VIKLVQRWRCCETVEPLTFGGHKTSVLSAHADRVLSMVAADPEMTIDDLRDRLLQDGVEASRSAVGRCLLALGLTRKKRRREPKSKIDRTSLRHAPPGKHHRPSF
jgi:transposase